MGNEFILAPIFDVRPIGLKILLAMATKQNRFSFIGHWVGIVESSSNAHAFIIVARIFRVCSIANNDFAGIVARSPEKIILVRAYRFWQAVTAAKKIDGTGFSVIGGENRRSGLFFGRERMIDGGHAGDHLFPAKLIGVVLGQDCGVLVMFGLRHAEWQTRLIAKVILDWKDRQHDGT